MSFAERDGKVVLTMSREDYEKVMFRLGKMLTDTHWRYMDEEAALMNRLNEGNPHYTPYRIGESKS